MNLRARFWQFVSKMADAYQVLGIQGLLAMAGSFSAGAWTAAATEWLHAWGPIAWLASGLFTVVVVIAILNGWSFFRLHQGQAEAWKAMAQGTYTVNPLAPLFTNQRIKVGEFFSPFQAAHVDKTFVDCEFIGPAVVAFINSNVDISGMVDCEFAEVADNVQVRNVVGFDRATIRRGRFYRMTLLFPPADARHLRLTQPNLPWLTPTPRNPNES